MNKIKTVLIFTEKGKVIDVMPCITNKTRNDIMGFIKDNKEVITNGFERCGECQESDKEVCDVCGEKMVSVDNLIINLLKNRLIEECNDQDYIKIINKIEIGE
jgi:hypothetical protein